MRKLRVSSVWKSPVRVSLWLKKFGPNFFINFLAELGSLENIWSDGLAVVLWWSIELYNWSRIQIFLGAQTWTVEHTNIFEEVLAHLKQHKFVQLYNTTLSKFKTVYMHIWCSKSQWYHHSKTQETLGLPAEYRMCKVYLSKLQQQKNPQNCKVYLSNFNAITILRPWHCQLSIKCADSVQLAECICPTLYLRVNKLASLMLR